jgi:hypothetical protein
LGGAEVLLRLPPPPPGDFQLTTKPPQ